jgi:tetratricopeptide (TPR) repeat protein
MERIQLKTLVFKSILALSGFLISVSMAHAQHENKTIRNGNQLYQNKKFDAAEKKYKQALVKNKESKEAGFNLGDALYEQKKYEEATELYNATAKKTKDKKLQSQAYHNLGNAQLQNKKYEESINAYKNALKLNPEDDDTRYNLAYAKSKLMQQQQQQKNKDDKKDKKDNKDQKNNENKDNKDQGNKDKKEQQDKNESDQKKQNEEEQKRAQQNPKMSKEDAERLLNALNNKEKDLHDKLKKKTAQGVRVQIEKDW